jgi:hypothetical protein
VWDDVNGIGNKGELEMKALTTSEKFGLIRQHGERLAMAGRGIPITRQSDVVESAQRVIELVQSIPKSELGIE